MTDSNPIQNIKNINVCKISQFDVFLDSLVLMADVKYAKLEHIATPSMLLVVLHVLKDNLPDEKEVRSVTQVGN